MPYDELGAENDGPDGPAAGAPYDELGAKFPIENRKTKLKKKKTISEFFTKNFDGSFAADAKLICRNGNFGCCCFFFVTRVLWLWGRSRVLWLWSWS